MINIVIPSVLKHYAEYWYISMNEKFGWAHELYAYMMKAVKI